MKQVVQCGQEFCTSTTVHGFNHISADKRHWTERVLWIGITAAAVWGAVEISMGQWQRYNENPTVMTLGKDFRTWRFSLPAITTCDVNRTHPDKLILAIKRYWNVTIQDEKYNYYSTFVNTVANSDLYHLDGFQQYKEDENLNVDLYKLAVEVMPDSQIKATWSERTTPKWIPVMTEAGACYVTNSLAIADSAIFQLISNDTEMFPITCKYSSLSCYVILEMPHTADSYIHSPYDVADMTTVPSRTFLTLNRFTELTVSETKCGRGVKELKQRRRGCLYIDEPIETGRQVYSTNSCRRTCRNRLAVKLCGCKPFYNNNEDGIPCTPSGMSCLANYAKDLANIAGVTCVCSPQCIDAVFQEIATEDQIWDRGPFLTRASVRFTVQAPRTRYTREIVFSFQDLVVSFSGAAGLFLGASFISFVEILYFILERILGVFIDKSKAERELKITKPHVSYEAERVQELTQILRMQMKYENDID